MSREAAFTALLAQVSGLGVSSGGPFVTVARRLRTLDDVNDPELPALFVTVGKQTRKVAPGVPARRTLTANLFVYANSADPHVASGIQLNGLLDAIEASLAPAAAFVQQTLGGVVAHAWIEGVIEIYEAVKTNRAAAMVPVTMLLP